MSESSSTTSRPTVLRWSVLEQDGKTTVVTYTEYPVSLGSARIKEAWTYLDGSENYLTNVEMLELISEQLSTRNEESLTLESNTPRSHSECWCNSSSKPDTSEAPCG